MRTWILAPDGYWAEVTKQVADRGPDPYAWDWPAVVADIGGTRTDVGHVLGLDRADLGSVHGHIADRWIANLIWSTLCTDRIGQVTVARVMPSSHAAWLTAVAEWTGRDCGDPLPAWSQRRARWLLCAHSDATGPVPLDGVRMVVGAVG